MVTQLNLPLRPWVPEWVGFLTMFLVFIPSAMMTGTYVATAIEVSDALGTLSEDISLGIYATGVGLVVSCPLIPKLNVGVTPKTLFLVPLIVEVMLNLLCARLTDIDIIVAVCFVIGLFKGLLMQLTISYLMPFFSPQRRIATFYVRFYPLVIGLGQISIIITAQLAYSYQWQHVYYFIAVLYLVAIIFFLAFFRYAPRPTKVRFKELDVRGQVFVSAAWLCLLYVCNYGKTLDWFSSEKICLLILLAPVFFLLFIYRMRTAPHPFLSLHPISCGKCVVGYAFMALASFFSINGSLIGSYAGSVLKLDNVNVNSLYAWIVPGLIIGGMFCSWWYRHRYRLRYIVFGGFLCYIVYLANIYFNVSPDATYHPLILSMLLSGVGMMVLYIAMGLYVSEGLLPSDGLSNVFYFLSFRTVLAPAVATCFYSNLLYKLQLEGMAILSETMSAVNSIAASKYASAFATASAAGHGYDTASQLATNSLYATLQQQALLLGIKEIVGYVLMAVIVLAVVSFFLPFHGITPSYRFRPYILLHKLFPLRKRLRQ